MSEPRQIAICHDYNSLHSALRARVHELNISYQTVDFEAEFTQGHASKILSPYPIKGLGRTTLGPMLQALGLAIVLVEDPKSLERISEYPKHQGCGPTRVQKPLSMGVANLPEARALERRLLRDLMRKNGRKGGKARKRYTTRRQRRRIAKRAAKTRWRRVRALQTVTVP